MKSPKTHTEIAEAAIKMIDAKDATSRTRTDQTGLNARLNQTIYNAYLRAVAAALDAGATTHEVYEALKSCLGNIAASYIASVTTPPDHIPFCTDLASFVARKALRLAGDPNACDIEVQTDGAVKYRGGTSS